MIRVLTCRRYVLEDSRDASVWRSGSASKYPYRFRSAVIPTQRLETFFESAANGLTCTSGYRGSFDASAGAWVTPCRVGSVLVQFDDAWQLGLKVDELNEGRFATVFIPDSPTPETGSVMIVSADRVVPANLSLVSAFSCLKARGAGISNILKTQERA